MKLAVRKWIQRLYDLSGALLLIDRLSLDRNLKRKILATWFKVFLFKKYDSLNKIADIAGFKTKFLDYPPLSYLFHEIFLGHEYYFTAKRDDPLIIDCGSNIGMSVLYFKLLYPKARIEAFEPGEESYSCLEENARNNLLSSVVTHKAALSSREGLIDFYYDPDNPGSLHMSTRRERMPKEMRRVKASILSNYVNEKVDFLKIDVEGAEREVLKELIDAGKLGFVEQMVIEYHHHIRGEVDAFSGMLKLLEDAQFGYHIEGHPGRPRLRGQIQDILIYTYKK